MTTPPRQVAALVGIALVAVAVGVPDLPHPVVIAVAMAGAALISMVAVWTVPAGLDQRRRRVVRVGAVVVALQLTGLARAFRVAVVHPAETASREAVGDGEAVLTNPRRSSDRLTQPRGRIVAADGTVLARSRTTNGILRRESEEPSTYSLVGYVSPLKFGLSGLEDALDEELTGIDGISLGAALRRLLLADSSAPRSVELSIDMSLQRRSAELLEGMTGSAVVIETLTGRILAMTSAPTIDPNRLVAVDEESSNEAQTYWDEVVADERRPLLSRATTGLYPPGSTFKVVTAATAIEIGLAGADSMYEDTGELLIDGRRLTERNRPDANRTMWSLTEGLAYSLNLVYAQVGLGIGAERFVEGARSFGIGAAIPGDLPTAAGQIASSPDFLSGDAALADSAFGQGELLVTPLHMALVATAVARDGTVPVPTLVDQVTEGGDVIGRRSPSTWRRAVSPQTASALDQMMVDSATFGYASTAAIDGVRIGAKTGTAESGRDDPHSWFIGYGSSGERSIAVAVCIEYGGEGGGLALGIGRELLNHVLNR